MSRIGAAIKVFVVNPTTAYDIQLTGIGFSYFSV